MSQMNKNEKTPPKKRMTKAESEAKQRLAFILYVENGFEQKTIADITGISETSISKWKTTGRWAEERIQYRVGPEKEMRRLTRMLSDYLDKMEEEGKTFDTGVGDTIKKITASIKDLKGEELMFYEIAWVCRKITDYAQETYGQARAAEEVDFLHEFLMSIR